MKLELLHKKPTKPNPSKPPLLFVHGICVGAWVWEEKFMPYFAEAGFDCWALSLRGHGTSEGAERLSFTSLADYTEDIDEAVRQIGQAPVLIGHSMGGAVVQRRLRDGGDVHSAALLASVPPWGLASTSLYMSFTAPKLYQELFKLSCFGVRNADEGTLRRALFSDDFPDDEFVEFITKVQDESVRVSWELQGFTPIAPLSNSAPIFVLGGEDDRFIPSDMVRATAAYYGTKAVIVPKLSHTMMLERNWKAAAEPLLNWLNRAS